MFGAATIIEALAGRPLRTRRRALAACRSLAGIIGRDDGLGLASTLRGVLRLGSRDARRLDRDIALQDAMTALEWAALLVRTTDQLVDDSQKVQIEGGQTLERLALSGKPVVLAPLHMGNYVFGLAVAMKRYFAGRPVLILRARDDDEADTRVMKRIGEIGCEMRFLQVSDKASYVEAVRFIRRGAVVIYFVDLPPSYGGPIDVTLFGRPARLALGIDALARVCGATVVPLAVTSGLAGDRVEIGRPFEVIDSGPAERARVARLVVGHVEAAILRHPAQWHLWPRFAEFAPLTQPAEPIYEAAA